MIDNYASQFEKNGYAVIPSFLERDFCDFSLSYFKIRGSGFDWNMECQAPNSKSFYSDIFAETILANSCSFLSKVVGKRLGPTYSYTRIYAQGDELLFHRDRPSCQFSATLCLNRPEDQENTAIYFSENESKANSTPIFLGVGDLCVYKGCDLYHWRDPFKSTWHLQSFLHYVDLDGEYQYELYDGRPYLGFKK